MPKWFTLLPHTVPRRITDPIVGVLARTGITPNQLTVLGFLGNVGAGVLAARGEFLPAGLVMRQWRPGAILSSSLSAMARCTACSW